MAHYDATLDQIMVGGDRQAREHLMRVLTEQSIPVDPPSEEWPMGIANTPLSMSAFHMMPKWGQKTKVKRANDILNGQTDKGALILVHVSARDYLKFWQTITIQRVEGDDVVDAHWPDIAPDEDRVDEWKNDLEKNYEGNAVPIPTPVLQISALGDLVTVTDGLARAAAVADIDEKSEPNPAHFKGDLMPLYLVARVPSGPQYDDFPRL